MSGGRGPKASMTRVQWCWWGQGRRDELGRQLRDIWSPSGRRRKPVEEIGEGMMWANICKGPGSDDLDSEGPVITVAALQLCGSSHGQYTNK